MSMYKIYIKQAWALIRQERFFSSVYIVGTGLAISMVMALAVAYHIRTANIAPEVHRDRMCYLSNVTYKLNGTKSNYKAACGPRLVKEVIGNLRVPEDVAVTTSTVSGTMYTGDDTKICDGARPVGRSHGLPSQLTVTLSENAYSSQFSTWTLV